MRIQLRLVLPWIACTLLTVFVWFVLLRAPDPQPAAAQPPPERKRERNFQPGNLSGNLPSFSSPSYKTKSHPAKGPSVTTAQVASAEPPGPSIGFLLSEIDSSLLSAEEDATLVEVQQKFASMMEESPVTDPSSPEYHHQWKQAQQYCDGLLRLRLGQDGFNRMNFLASQESERMKQP